MIDYADMYGGLECAYDTLLAVQKDLSSLANDYGILNDAKAVAQELVDAVGAEKDKAAKLLSAQEQRENADARRDYFRGIGPL